MTELAAANGAERAQALLQLTQRLTALIQEETRLFKARRPHEAIELQTEKSELANIYRAEVARARQEPTRFSGASEQAKSMLREATKTFHAALDENGHVVSAMKRVTEGVVKAIADEAARQRSAGSSYGPGAAQNKPQSGGFAMAVNRTA
ncbi:MAG: flagellar basal-body protein FlbY [Pseudomonadota bacterium]|nr:flagellar basal-body protein FlbY [Pseudomonadota bacterium]